MKIEEKYHDPILAVIKEKGPMGVNALAKSIDMPLSSVHKYLERQTYFRKNADKQWDLPENVELTTVNTLEDNRAKLLSNSIESNAVILQETLELFSNGFTDFIKQVRMVGPLLANNKPAVASTPQIDKSLLQLQEKVSQLPDIIKKKKSDIPEQYLDVLTTVNWLELVIDIGRKQFTEVISTEVAELILGERAELLEETYETLIKYSELN